MYAKSSFSPVYFFQSVFFLVLNKFRLSRAEVLTRDSVDTVERCPIFVANSDGRMLAIVEQRPES